eukprot:252054-Alexandrium_andersonii.AAC.1
MSCRTVVPPRPLCLTVAPPPLPALAAPCVCPRCSCTHRVHTCARAPMPMCRAARCAPEPPAQLRAGPA